MSKLFQEFPTDIEMYNPDEQWESFNLNYANLKPSLEDTFISTYDDEGLLHSHDDYPASIQHGISYNTLIWYKHGVVFREGDKSPVIELSKMEVDGEYKIYEYASHDANNYRQFYGGMPSFVSQDPENLTTVHLKWHHNGLVTRYDDLPAVINYRKGVRSEIYHYLNGDYHRDNDLPAIITDTEKTWSILDTYHRENGPAQVKMDQTFPSETYYLYGIPLEEEKYKNIRLYQNEHKVPIWVAFLREVSLAPEINLEAFMDKDKYWEATLPLVWVVKALGVTEEKWNRMEDTFRNSLQRYIKFTSLDKFFDIINYSETRVSSQKTFNN
jgi:hypothetical protein